jgi:hypothetical protein
VIVPIDNANETAVGAFRSTDGGASWTDVTTIALAEIDEAGKVFVAWSDSRFERGRANDIVFSSSTDGFTWSAVTRVPIDAIKSGVDHFIPGLAWTRRPEVGQPI